MQSCLGIFYYQYVKKEVVTKHTWSTTVFGDVIHLQLEEFLNKYKDNTEFKTLVSKIINKKKIKFAKEFLTEHDLGFEQLYDRIKNEYEKEKSTIIKFTKKFPEKTFFDYGNKWGPEVLKFIVKYLKIDEPFTSEKRFEVELTKKQIDSKVLKHHKIILNGVYDHIREHDIIDFKTTTVPEKFYYIDWHRDLQSLMYYFAFYLENGKFPEGFTYIVFNILDAMFFVTQHSYDNSDDQVKIMKKHLSNVINYFLSLYSKAEDTRYWKPEKTKCHFCYYNKICKVSKAK